MPTDYPMITCKTCGKHITADYPYRYTTHDYVARTMDSTPDGTAMIVHVDAGTFCSSECMLRYLMRHTRVGSRLKELQRVSDDAMQAFMVQADIASHLDSEHADRIIEIQQRYRVELDKAWGALERAIDGDPDPEPAKRFMPDCGGDYCELITAGASGRCDHIRDCRDAYAREAKPDA